MIKTRKQMKFYIDEDIAQYPPMGGFFARLINVQFKFTKALRKHEYFWYKVVQEHKIWYRPWLYFWEFRHFKLGLHCGFYVPINRCGYGLYITHPGTVVINAVVGNYLTINTSTNLGNSKGEENIPRLGNHVWIGPGAKLFGAIDIADGIAVGANAVVNKSFLEPNITIAGIPAKKISNHGSKLQI